MGEAADACPKSSPQRGRWPKAGGGRSPGPASSPSVVPAGRHLPRWGEDLVVVQARLWLGTPYRHQASTLGAGCDCLGLIRGVWRGLYGQEPEPPPPYRPDWAEIGVGEPLLEAFRRWLVAIPVSQALPGDVLVFRMAPGAAAKHCAIKAAPDRIIHAYWGRACVESALGRWWRERCVAAFRFPPFPNKHPTASCRPASFEARSGARTSG
ncbi:peptidase [Caulobacter vibrioides]|nr:NlpC/P60 family protein [Caulobacter vibrioides]ATC26795.1 peptidase [Caulobacter vibrioides]AZH14848.1 peptidase [Caulobacter vibrioides]PLR07773.1 peptidase [Caulobacter vibrioides]